MTFAGLTVSGLTITLAGALLFSAAAPAEAGRRPPTRFDAIRDCERVGNVQLRKLNPAFRHFMIDRSRVVSEKYADRVGPLFVATIYHGRATYETVSVSRPTRFVCLHGGMHRRALFVYTLPD